MVDITAVNPAAFNTNSYKNWGIGINSSYLYWSLVRDSVNVYNLIDGFEFFFDTTFIPGFIMYDDAGMTNSILPISVCAGLKQTLVLTSYLALTARAYCGMEFIDDYQYNNALIYGGFLNAQYKPVNNLILGLSGGLSDLQNYYFEAGAGYDFSFIEPILAFTMDGNYKSIKTAFLFPVTPQFEVFGGINFTLEYYGVYYSGGLEYNHFKLGPLDNSLGLSFSYNMSGWLSVNLAWNFSFEKSKPISQKDGLPTYF